jgi:hypothetical protein
MDMQLRFRRSTLAGILGLPLLLLFCFLYYIIFAANLNLYDGESGLFQLALNSHDHFIYVNTVDLISDRGFQYGLNNDFGIASIYLALSNAFPFLVDPDFTLISFLFNCVTLCLCYLVYASICDRLGLGMFGKISFFANTYFIYHAQLINKDILTILSFLLVIYFGLRKRLLPILLLSPLLVLVRQQLAVFAIIYMFLMQSRQPWGRIILVYFITSLVAAYLSVNFDIIGEDSLGSGFSAFLMGLNQQYFIGYLIFNPVRVLQYIGDAYASFFLATGTGGVDTAKLLRIPQLITLLLLSKPLLSIVIHFNDWLKTPARPLVLVVVAYLLAWLMNPTINARYVMLITPVLVLFALYVRNFKHRVVI